MPSDQTPSKNSDYSSTVKTSSPKYISDMPLFRTSQIAAEAKFSFIEHAITTGGLPVMGKIFGNLPTVAFGVAKYVDRGSSSWEATTGIGIDIGLNLLPGASQTLLLSDLAAHVAEHKDEYMQSFERAHAVGGASFDVSDEMERWAEIGSAQVFSLPSKAVDATKQYVANHPKETLSVLFGPFLGPLASKAFVNNDNNDKKNAPSQFEGASASDFSESSPTNFYLPPNPYLTKTETDMPYQGPLDSETVKKMQQETRENFDTSGNSNTYNAENVADGKMDVPENIPSGERTKTAYVLPKIAHRPKSSNWGKPSGYIKAIPDGLQLGAQIEYKPFGNLNFGFNLDQYAVGFFWNIGKQMFGKREYTGTVDIYGEKYSYTLSKVKGMFNPGEAELTVKREGGEKYERPIQLEWNFGELSFSPDNINSPENKKRIEKGLRNIISEDLNKWIPIKTQKFQKQYQNAVNAHDLEGAKALSEVFFNRYKDIPEINRMAPGYRAIIRDYELYASSNAYLEQGNLDAAISTLGEISNKDSATTEYLDYLQDYKSANEFIEQGQKSIKEKNIPQALDFFSKAQDISPEHLGAIIGLANAYSLTNQLPSAIEQAKKAAEIDPSYLDFLYELQNLQKSNELVLKGKTSLESNDLESAQSFFEEAERLVPNHVGAVLGLVEILASNDLAGAIIQMEKIASKDQSYQTYLNALKSIESANKLIQEGKDLIKTEKQEAAQLKFEKALELFPEHSEAAVELAKIHAGNSDYDKAIAVVRTISELEKYEAHLRASMISRRAAPFMQVLSQLAEEHIQSGRLSPTLEGGLRILCAVHHLHPQVLVALSHSLVCQEAAICQAWGLVLEERLSSPLFITGGILSAVRVLGAAPHIPAHQSMSEIVNYAQQVTMTYEVINDLGVLSGQWNLQKAVRSSSLAMALPMLVTPLALRAYDSIVHQEWLPETRLECLKRDTLPMAVGFLSALAMPPPLTVFTAASNLLLPILKFATGSHDFQAEQGLLINARKQLVHSDFLVRSKADERYGKLPPAYQKELLFRKKIDKEKDLSHFKFSLDGGDGSVPIALAATILSEELDPSSFDEKTLNQRNHLLDTLSRVCDVSTNDQRTVGAKDLLASAMAMKGYLNTAQSAAEDAVISQQIAAAEQQKNRTVVTTVSDWLIEKGWRFGGLLDDQESTAESFERVDQLIKKKKKLKKYAAKFSAGDFQNGFAYYLLKACEIRQEKKEGLDTLSHELMLISVLSYMYAESSFSFTEEKISSPQKAIATLIFVRANCTDKDLQSLANRLLEEFLEKDQKKKEKKLIKKICSPRVNSTSDKLQPQEYSSVRNFLSEIKFKSEIEKTSSENTSLVALLNCFYALTRGDESIDEDLLNVLKKEFMEPTPSHPDKSQFRFEQDFSNYHKKKLVEIFLSGMLAFVYMLKTLTNEKADQKLILRLKNTILDSVHFRGYLPPFSIMMVRLAGRYSISETQARAMLAWYNLDLNEHCAYKKLDMLLAMHRSRYFSGSRQVEVYGKLCRVWGQLVRFTIYKNSGYDTTQLNFKVRAALDENEALKHAKKYLKKGANPNYGQLIHLAVERQWLELLELLCQYGADLEERNARNLTPIKLASIKLDYRPKSTKLKKIIAILGKYGAESSKNNRINFLFSPILWWYYNKKTPKQILASHFTQGELDSLYLQPIDCSSARFMAIDNVKNTSDTSTEDRQLIQDSLDDLSKPYTIFQMRHLLQYYIDQTPSGKKLIFDVVPDLIEYFDRVKAGEHIPLCDVLLSQWKNEWIIYYVNTQTNVVRHYILCAICFYQAQKLLEKIIGEQLFICSPQSALKVKDSSAWLIEKFRLLLGNNNTDPTNQLLGIRYNQHMPILANHSHAKFKVDDLVDLSERGADPVCETSQIANIHQAVIKGDEEAILRYIAQDCSIVSLKSTTNRYPIYYAAFHHRPRVLELLLQHGADPFINMEAPDFCDSTLDVLIKGIQIDNWNHDSIYHERVIASMEILIFHGVLPHQSNDGRETLINSAQKVDQSIIKELQALSQIHSKVGAALLKCAKGECAVTQIKEELKHVRRHPILLSTSVGLDINAFFTLLLKSGPLELLKLIFQVNPQLANRNLGGESLLHLAVSASRDDAVKMILDYSPAQIRAINQDGNTPLHLLIQILQSMKNSDVSSNYRKIIELLCWHPAINFYQVNHQGKTVLEMANTFSNEQVCPLINLLSQAKQNTEKLWKLAEDPTGNVMEAKALLESGFLFLHQQEPVSLNAAIHKAAASGNIPILKLLLYHDPALLLLAAGGNLLPLHYACKTNQRDAAYTLLNFSQQGKSKGVLTRILCHQDDRGYSPLDYAFEGDYALLYRMLLPLYNHIISKNAFEIWLNEHKAAAIKANKKEVLCMLIIMLGLTVGDISEFISNCISHTSPKERYIIWDTLIDAETKGVFGGEALKVFKDNLKVYSSEFFYEYQRKHQRLLNNNELPAIDDLSKWKKCLDKSRYLYHSAKDGTLLVHRAASTGQLLLLRQLIQYDYQLLTIKAHSGWLPLHYATANLQVEVLEFLLSLTPEYINKRVTGIHNDDTTLLFLAIQSFGYYHHQDKYMHNRLERLQKTLQILLGFGASLSLVNIDGESTASLIKKHNLPPEILTEKSIKHASENEPMEVDEQYSWAGEISIGVSLPERIDHPQYFHFQPVLGDNNCGFSALNVTREKLKAVLLSKVNDPSYLKELAYEIMSEMISHENFSAQCIKQAENYGIPKSLVIDYYNKRLHAQETNTALANLYNACISMDVYKRYIHYLTQPNVWLGMHSIKCYAMAKNIELYIFSQKKAFSKELVLTHVHVPDNSKRQLHILWSANYGGHFDLLKTAICENGSRLSSINRASNEGIHKRNIGQTNKSINETLVMNNKNQFGIFNEYGNKCPRTETVVNGNHLKCS